MRLSLKVEGIEATIKRIQALPKEIRDEVQEELNDFGRKVEGEAKALAPADEGNLRNSIVSEPGNMSVSIFARADYAAYLEFGTKKFASAYVNSLPQDWKSYAAQFKGSGGSKGDFFEVIRRWVKRKGIDDKAAYAIALSILKNGIREQPFLYPAFQKHVPALIQNLKAVLK